MVLNLLKIVFVYFLFRFFKSLLKGFVRKKINEASENIQQQMNRGFQHQHQNASNDRTSSSQSPKTFEAEYRIVKD